MIKYRGKVGGKLMSRYRTWLSADCSLLFEGRKVIAPFLFGRKAS